MMSCSALTPAQAESYFEKEAEYYTKNMTNYDRWHGTLAETIGLKGECSKEQLDNMLKHIKEEGRERAGVDCTFSAPKSVSLAMAKDEKTRDDMRAAHQKAVARIADKIELELIKTRSGGEKIQSRNMIAAEFLHETARPTKENNYVPDLDLHSHLVILNDTIADGKDLAIDYEKIMSKQNIKEYGLMYRQELAKELQGMGYELELTDEKQGFFELAGVDREIINEYSHRRQEIEKISAEHGITDMQKANQFSRQAKGKSKVSIDEIIKDVKKDLFDSKKVTIKKEEKDNGRTDELANRKAELYARERAEIDREYTAIRSGQEDFISPRLSTNFADIAEHGGRGFEVFAERHNLSDLPTSAVDKEQERINLLLPPRKLCELAKLQTDKVRDTYLRRQNENKRRTENRARSRRIEEIADRTIKKLSAEKFAFTPIEARQRIMAAGVLENITQTEAKKLMEEAGLVSLGQMERNGTKTKDRYLTTEENIQKEKDIIQRMKDGKGTIQNKVLTMEESKAALDRAEARAKEKGLESASFSIKSGSGEQAQALHHVLVSNDKYIAIQGLAGTGKTTLMERMKWVADEQNITLRGVCFTGKAADGLQSESGIESSTIHSFLNKLEQGRYNEPSRLDNLKTATSELAIEALNNGRIPPKETPQPERTRAENLKRAAREIVADTVLNGADRNATKAQLRAEDRQLYYEQENARQKEEGGIKQEWDFSNVTKAQNREIWIVDEAGLVDNNLMNELQKAAEARGAQVVLSGDVDQLPPVGAGSPMRSMIEEGMGTSYLSDIRRQQDNAELLKAVKESVKGDHLITFEKLDKAGDYHEIEKATERRAFIHKEMTEGVNIKDYKDNLLLASTNKDRKQYNKDIRQIYIDRGELEKGKRFEISVPSGEKTITERRNFAANDRIIFTANDNKLEVKNGTLAVIDHIDEKTNTVTATTDAGKQVTWNMDKYNSIDHAYCVTNYKAQGMSVGGKVKDEQGQTVGFKGKVVCDMNTNGTAQNRNALYVNISRAKTHAVVVTDDKAKLERQTRNFAAKVTSKDFKEKIRDMGRHGIQNNDRYKAPDVDGKKDFEKAIAQIARHTAPPPPPLVVKEQARAAEVARQQAQEKAKAQTRTIKQPTQSIDTGRGGWGR